MWPSTSCCTERGSQFGIWPATAVISPKLNEPRPRSMRMRRRAARRSLRIRRRRPLATGAGLLRLRPNKRRILALDAQEGLLRRRVHTPGALDGNEDAPAGGYAPVERHGHVPTAAEQPRRSRGSARADPGLVGSARGRAPKIADDERGVPARVDDEAAARERDRARARLREDRRDALLPRERRITAVELARERRRPDAERDRRTGCDRSRRDGRDRPAGTQRDDVGALAPRLVQDARAQLRRRLR